MTRLSVLVGIGLMLVGAAAYALPATQDFVALFPAFAGILIGTGGFVAMSYEAMRKKMTVLNTLVAAITLVYASIRVVPDGISMKNDRALFIADLDSLGLTAVYLYFAIRSFIEIKRSTRKKDAETPV